MKYIKIFEFQAMDKVKEGKRVWMLDRYYNEVFDVIDMTVGELVKILDEGNATDRYEFWYAEEKDDAEL